jgi:hypothetical protein
VLTVLKNASAGSMPLELQATAFTRAVVVGVTTLIDNAIRRGRVPFQGIPDQ